MRSIGSTRWKYVLITWLEDNKLLVKAVSISDEFQQLNNGHVIEPPKSTNDKLDLNTLRPRAYSDTDIGFVIYVN